MARIKTLTLGRARPGEQCSQANCNNVASIVTGTAGNVTKTRQAWCPKCWSAESKARVVEFAASS